MHGASMRGDQHTAIKSAREVKHYSSSSITMLPEVFARAGVIGTNQLGGYGRHY